MPVNWEEIQRNKYASDEATPSNWPEGLKPISVDGLALFGIDRLGNLYWDGQRVEAVHRLNWLERTFAFAAAVAAIVIALVEVGRSAGWWM
ncbi:MAG TPA: hypothetical protein VMF90_14760 [Rhizobiaceae bacterium]|nr:hypothetical protein [Rhizobiaceae bacterium]